MSIIDFPTELLQIIFAHCDRNDQAAIGAVCHRWAEAVQPFLFRKTCLMLSVPGCTRRSRYKVLDKTILLESDRQYTGFRVEWGYLESDWSKQVLKELLDVCQERFPVLRLYLSAPPQQKLIHFFVDRRQWLQSLVELSVTLGWSKPAGCELSLPNLKQLTWCEPRSLEISERPFILTAPELYRLKIVSNVDLKRDHLDHPALLSCLKLKSCPKLENVTIERLSKLNQCHVDSFEPFLRQLKILSLYDCDNDGAIKLYEKCTNLKELTIRQEQVEFYMNLKIPPGVSANLENLTLMGVPYDGPLILYGDATFPKLQRLYLHDVEFDEDDYVSLVAPQLVTFISFLSCLGGLEILHKEQIRTMRVDIDNDLELPPPNVTELHLQFPYLSDTSKIQKYLANFPNLTRLTLNADPYTSQIVYCVHCEFFKHLPKLESFAAYQLTLRLVDCNKFAGLKSLVLSHCVIEAKGYDEHVQLTMLDYVRIEQVTIDGARRDQFPIRINERQPPIDIVRVTHLERNVFNSRSFKSTIRDELEPEFAG